VEGGIISTNNQELYELMRMKRSHGMARESDNLQKYVTQYPDVNPQFLFVTDGYNFRSTEINAVLGLRQLSRLDATVEHRKDNFLRFTEIIAQHQDKFHPVIYQEGNSNFAFPFICRTPRIAANMKAVFDKNGVEHRPIVGGNLLRQPFLKGHKFGVPRKDSNVDLLNVNGMYIGNSQFVARSDVEFLERIMVECHV
jgi:CDP-6-deoxy-D-xylo-4-hexulose-3-dehydrase